jgi:hypothetical protein
MSIYLLFFFINFIFYFLFLILLNNFLVNKFFYPFRILDLINFITNTAIFGFASFFYFGLDFMIITIIINFNFFYIIFHIQNMINTSPRTRILIDIFNKNNKQVYTEKKIVENRIKRLLSNKQILISKKIIKLNNDKKTLYFINLVFKLIKKF